MAVDKVKKRPRGKLGDVSVILGFKTAYNNLPSFTVIRLNRNIVILCYLIILISVSVYHKNIYISCAEHISVNVVVTRSVIVDIVKSAVACYTAGVDMPCHHLFVKSVYLAKPVRLLLCKNIIIGAVFPSIARILVNACVDKDSVALNMVSRQTFKPISIRVIRVIIFAAA